MRKSDDRKDSAKGFAVSVALGCAAGFVVAVVLLAIFAVAVAAGTISDSLMQPIAVFAALAGAISGSTLAVKRHGAKLFLVGLSTGGLMFLTTLVCSALSGSGRLFGGMSPSILAATVCGGIVGGLLCLNKGKRRRA